MSENSKGALGSKDALLEFVKQKYTFETTQLAQLFINDYRFYFYAGQAYGNPTDEQKEKMHDNASFNDVNFWVYREQMRFSDVLDVYYERPNKKILAVMDNRPDLKFHHLHMSLEEPGMVAYTPSIAYGVADRQVRTKLGSYLAKFYSEHLTALQIKRLVDGHADVQTEIYDKEEIVAVYINGPSSCMGGGEFNSELDGIHPCSAYETSDWKIAVLKDGDVITDRALICVHGVKEENPYKGCFVRCYGDNADALKEKLIEMGYAFERNWPDGARLRAIDCSGGWIAPYLDGQRREVGREGEFFVIGGDDFTFDCASGYVNECNTVECNNCGDDYDPDEMGEDYAGNSVCQGCLDSCYRFAYYSTRTRSRTGYVHEDEVVYCESNGEYYMNDRYVLEFHQIHQCIVRDEWYHEDDMVCSDEGWVHKDDYVEPEQEELPIDEPVELKEAA